MPNLALSAGLHLHDLVFFEALGGATTSLSNIGFDRIENIDDDTIEYLWVGYVGVGIAFRYAWLFANAYVAMPFHDEDEIDFGPRVTVQTGYAF